MMIYFLTSMAAILRLQDDHGDHDDAGDQEEKVDDDDGNRIRSCP